VTSLRTRFVLAFTYILVTVVVALEVPLAITLQRRARAEVESRLLVEAQSIAATIGAENLTPDRRNYLQRVLVPQVARQLGDVRVIVLDERGRLLADSTPIGTIGEPYDTPGRPEIGRALRGLPATDVRFSRSLGQDIMVAAVPIVDRGVRLGAVRLTEGLAHVNANVRRITLGLAAIGLSALLAGVVIAFALSASLAGPLSALARAAARLGSGDLSARAGDPGGAAEVRSLARSFDAMAERLERTVRAQREFVANASHQLRTPLTGMKLRLESATAEGSTEALRRQLEAAEREVDRLSRIVDRLLLLAERVESGRAAEVDLAAAAERAVERWRERAGRAGARLALEGDGGTARSDPADVDQILDNLLDNAVSHAPGPITVRTGRHDRDVFLAVEDRGPGIPPQDRARVTERFYRGRGAPAGGSGLGLAIVRELAERWGGRVDIGEAAGGGASVEVRLPAAGPAERSDP
jgi:signal transduction histidine kinase